jgi:hypothetical protein
VTERLGRLLRTAADFLAPQPPSPLPRMVLTATRSRQKLIEDVEWLPDALVCAPLDPPLEDAVLGRYDQLDLSHDVHGWDRDGRRTTVKHTYHVTWREVRV